MHEENANFAIKLVSSHFCFGSRLWILNFYLLQLFLGLLSLQIGEGLQVAARGGFQAVAIGGGGEEGVPRRRRVLL